MNNLKNFLGAVGLAASMNAMASGEVVIPTVVIDRNLDAEERAAVDAVVDRVNYSVSAKLNGLGLEVETSRRAKAGVASSLELDVTGENWELVQVPELKVALDALALPPECEVEISTNNKGGVNLVRTKALEDERSADAYEASVKAEFNKSVARISNLTNDDLQTIEMLAAELYMSVPAYNAFKMLSEEDLNAMQEQAKTNPKELIASLEQSYPEFSSDQIQEIVNQIHARNIDKEIEALLADEGSPEVGTALRSAFVEVEPDYEYEAINGVKITCTHKPSELEAELISDTSVVISGLILFGLDVDVKYSKEDGLGEVELKISGKLNAKRTTTTFDSFISARKIAFLKPGRVFELGTNELVDSDGKVVGSDLAVIRLKAPVVEPGIELE
jgi:hypothetical protein